MSDEHIPTLAEIRAIERGERPLEGGKPLSGAKEKQAAVEEALARARNQVSAIDLGESDSQTRLNSLARLGVTGEFAVTIVGLVVLEEIASPFLDAPVDGKLTIKTVDTARALWAFKGGLGGASPLLSALALERAAAALDIDEATPLRVRAAELRAGWDTAALQCLEECGKTKQELDTELLVRLNDIIGELETLK